MPHAQKAVAAEACKIDRRGDIKWEKCLIVEHDSNDDTYIGVWEKNGQAFKLPGN